MGPTVKAKPFGCRVACAPCQRFAGLGRRQSVVILRSMSWRAIPELLLLATLWGSAYLFTRAAVPEFGPLPLVAMRFAIASCLLVPVMCMRGGLPALWANKRRFLLLGIVFTALPFATIGYSAQFLGAGLLAILNATAPLFGAVVATLWVGEHMSRARMLGLVIGFAGVLILVWGSVGLTPGGVFAVALMMGVSLCWAFAANYTRLRLQAVDPVVVTAANTLVAMVVTAPLAWWWWPEVTPSSRAWTELLFLGCASSAGGMLLYFRLLRSIGTVPTMSVTFLSPVVAMVSGAFYLGEAVTLQTVLGGAVVLVGTALVLGIFQRAVPAPPRPAESAD